MKFETLFDLDKRFLSIMAGLARDGKDQTEIHWGPTEIFALNADKTVLYRVETSLFQDPAISFFAQDYSGDEFVVDGNKIFFKETGVLGYEVITSAGTPESKWEDLNNIFEESKNKVFCNSSLVLDQRILQIIDPELSHIEIIRNEENQLVVIQRNIFTGKIIYITKIEKKLSILSQSYQVDSEEIFDKVGIRTPDFLALFKFDDEITFTFSQDGSICFAKGDVIEAILARCIYDSLGTISYYQRKSNKKNIYVDNINQEGEVAYGGKEPEERRSESSHDTEDKISSRNQNPKRKLVKRRI